MDNNLKDRDVLLVRERGSNELHAANMDRGGKVKTAKLNEGDNPDFLKIDRQGNILENFFENFKRQIKDPTRFEFFRVPMEKLNEVIRKLQNAFKNPNKPENKQFLDMHRVEPEDFLKKRSREQSQTQMQAKPEDGTKGYAVNPDLVDWKKLEQIGITRERLEKTGRDNPKSPDKDSNNLDRILNYQKTGLIAIPVRIGEETHYSDARLSLRKQDDGTFAPAVHLIRNKPELERPYFGVQLTGEDKQNLLQTGNLGRIIEPEYPQGKAPVLLSIDRLTNELVAFRADRINVPEKVKGVELNEQQRAGLSAGKSVRIENMTDRNGNPFSASLQFNADKRGFEFQFDRELQQSQKQGNGQNDVPKTFRKKELTGEQRDSLQEGKTVYVDGLVDKKGKGYSGYITLNKETGRTDFMFPKQYRDALAASRVIPDDRHKTQVAVNSEGKTGEATKNVKEPLKKGQTKPDEK
jgi:hypothetical protein